MRRCQRLPDSHPVTRRDPTHVLNPKDVPLSIVEQMGGFTGLSSLDSDSGCTTDGQTVQRGKTGLTGTVVVGISMNNPGSVSLGGIITRGRYVKLETSNLSGTPTYTMAATQEVTGTLVQ